MYYQCKLVLFRFGGLRLHIQPLVSEDSPSSGLVLLTPNRKLLVIGSCAKLLEVVWSGWPVAGGYLLGGHGGDVIWSLSVWERVIYGLRVCLWNYRLIASFLPEPLNPC